MVKDFVYRKKAEVNRCNDRRLVLPLYSVESFLRVSKCLFFCNFAAKLTDVRTAAADSGHNELGHPFADEMFEIFIFSAIPMCDMHFVSKLWTAKNAAHAEWVGCVQSLAYCTSFSSIAYCILRMILYRIQYAQVL